MHAFRQAPGTETKKAAMPSVGTVAAKRQERGPYCCSPLGWYLAGVAFSCISQGFPLSVPAACGRHEIYHLKYHSYPILSISRSGGGVKAFFAAHLHADAFGADAVQLFGHHPSAVPRQPLQ